MFRLEITGLQKFCLSIVFAFFANQHIKTIEEKNKL